MRTAIRAALGVGIGMGLLASTASAEQRTRLRDGKGSVVSLHQASLSPSEGLERMSTPDGQTLYVAPRPTWSSMDILSAATEPGTDGMMVELQLAGAAARRLGNLSGQDARIAVIVGGELVSAGTITREGRIELTAVPPEQADRISRVVKGEAAPTTGPLLTIVSAGSEDGLYYVDAYVQNVADLRSYQVRLITGGGDSGQLELAHVMIDRARPDYVFGGNQAIEASSRATGLIGAVLYDGGATSATPVYLGTYAFRPTADAQGTFRINVDLSPETLLADSVQGMIAYSAGADARIIVGSPAKERK